MKLAILFWFYKDPDLCENRLRVLRSHNPDAAIFGLYGGDPESADSFRARLNPRLDDFYCFTSPKSSLWKWFNGDLVITQWHRDRGHQLDWDSIVIVQWDMLILGDVNRLFASLKKDEILLSGLRPVSQVADWWLWTKRGDNLDRHNAFVKHLCAQAGYDGPLLCCQFIVVCFPKTFLDRYAQVDAPETGFIEYRVPTYARAFGIEFCTTHPYSPAWVQEPNVQPTWRQSLINAESRDVPLRRVLAALALPGGPRVFHPFAGVYPLSPSQWPGLLFKDFCRSAARIMRRISTVPTSSPSATLP